MNTPQRTLGLLSACLFAPLTVFTIGDRMGAGVRFPLFLYQDTVHGTSLIPVWREIDYVASGLIGGRSAIAILLWTLGVLVLLAAVAFLVVRWYEEHEKPVALLVAGAGASFLLSCVAQYGPFFHGPAGCCVPVGLPLIFGIAWFMWRGEEEEEIEEDGEDESSPPDGS